MKTEAETGELHPQAKHCRPATVTGSWASPAPRLPASRLRPPDFLLCQLPAVVLCWPWQPPREVFTAGKTALLMAGSWLSPEGDIPNGDSVESASRQGGEGGVGGPRGPRPHLGFNRSRRRLPHVTLLSNCVRTARSARGVTHLSFQVKLRQTCLTCPASPPRRRAAWEGAAHPTTQRNNSVTFQG